MAMIDVGNINSLVSTFKSISSSLGSAFYATGCGIVGSIGIIRRPECNAMIALVGLRHLQKTPRTPVPRFFSMPRKKPRQLIRSVIRHSNRRNKAQMMAEGCKSLGLTNLNLEGRPAPKPLCRSRSTESSGE
jgi:hypothetical protein